MIIIRFSRVGKKGHAQYKIVLAEKSYPVQGKFIEQLGSYDPHKKEAVLKADRIKYWLGEGAACSDSVYNLLVREAVIKGDKRKLAIKIATKEEEKQEEASEEVPAKETKEAEDSKEEAVTEQKKEEEK